MPGENKGGTNYTIIIAAAILAGAYLFTQYVPKPNVPVPPVPIPAPMPYPNPSPYPTPAPAMTPAEEFKAAVAKADPAKAKRMGYYYKAMADVVGRIPSIPSQTLRNWLVASDTYLIQGTDLTGSIPGIGAAKDKLLAEAVGLENRELVKADLDKVCGALVFMAAACGVQ